MNMKGKNSMDLVCHYQFENGSSQFLFLDVEDGGESLLVKRSLSFFTETFVYTLASSNGYLLLSGYKQDQLSYFVFNPLTKNTIILPQPSINLDHRLLRVGLASDGGQFQVVLVEEAVSSKSTELELQIFSSATGEWRRHHHAINLPVLTSLPEFEFQELKTPPLYSNGSIHWEIAGYLLVYQVETSHCELYELPNFFEDWSWQSTMTYRRSFCESGGRVYYCYTDFDGIHVWDLLNEHDNLKFFNAYNSYDPKRFSWRLVRSIKHEIFSSKNQKFLGHFSEWEPNMITPIAYNEQADTIYLQLPGTVVSYNSDTAKMSSLCTYSYPGMNFNCCLFLPFYTSGLCNMQKREGELQADREIELNLPLAKVESFPF